MEAAGILSIVCTIMASAVLLSTLLLEQCRFCGKIRLRWNTLKVYRSTRMCRKCAKEKKDYAAFRGVDLENFCYTKEERGIPHKGNVTCFDNDVGHFKVEDRNGD